MQKVLITTLFSFCCALKINTDSSSTEYKGHKFLCHDACLSDGNDPMCAECCQTRLHETDWMCSSENVNDRAACCDIAWDATCWDRPSWKNKQHSCNMCTGWGWTSSYNDPKLVNMAGQHFDVLQLGTFSYVRITKESSDKPLLSLDATIARAAGKCSAAYVSNMSLSGPWIHEANNGQDIQFRAVKGSSKADSFEIKLDDNWQKVHSLSGSKETLKKISPTEVRLKIHDVTFKVFDDIHVSTAAHFLNLNIGGLNDLEKSGMYVGGLLGRGEHSFATVPADECNVGRHKTKFTDEDAFLSHGRVIL